MNLIVARSLVHSPHCGVWRRVTLNSLPTTKIRCAYSWLNSRFSTDSGRLLVRTLPRNSTNTRQQWPKWRYFASGPPSPDDTDFSKLRRLEDANPERIHGIQVNPDSIGSEVLPGNLVYKFYKWTGNTRKVPLELVHGYFWMVNDLRVTKGKPTFSNKEMITEEEAQIFPMLTGLESLSRKVTDLPYLFIADKGTTF